MKRQDAKISVSYDKSLAFYKQVQRKAKIMELLLKNKHVGHFVLKYVMKPMAFEKVTEKNKGFRYSFLFNGAGVLPKDDLEFLYLASRLRVKALDNVIDALEKKRPIVWVQWACSKMVLQGFDVAGLTPELLVNLGYGINPERAHAFLAEAEKQGYLLEGCSSQRSFLGTIMFSEAPKAAAMISYTHPCDSGVTAFAGLNYLTDIPSFEIDSPYVRDADGIKYLGNQMAELIKFLEKELQQTFDWKKFEEAIHEYNQFSMYLHETSEMMKAKPSPVSSLPLMSLWTMKASLTGYKELTTCVKKIHASAKKRLQTGKGTVHQEKIRVLLWEPNFSFFALAPWLEETFGAVIVCDYLSYHPYHQIDTSSREKMLEGMAMIDLTYGMVRQTSGAVEQALDEMVMFINEFSPDCVIMTGNESCKQEWAASKLYIDYCKKYDLPVLALNADVFDSRFVTEEQVKSQIREFFKSNEWC